MNLTWITDPHLDYMDPADRPALYDKLAAAGDGIVITGDIANGVRNVRILTELRDHLQAYASKLEQAPQPVFFVLGNHDYWDGRIQDKRDEIIGTFSDGDALESFETLYGIADETQRMHYLPVHAPFTITGVGGGVALVGADGWADGGYGDWARSRVWLHDYDLIRDLAPHAATRERLQLQLRRLAIAEACVAQEKLLAAFKEHDRVILATHVPPFVEATWHEGKHSDENYLPHFASKAMGDMLRELMGRFHQKQVLVLCGHTHGAGEAKILPNLRVWTGGSQYGSPSIAKVFDVSEVW